MGVKAGHGIGLLLTIILIALIFLYILPRVGGFGGGGILWALLANTIIGFIVIFLVNAIFGLGIVYNLLTWIVVAIFGLPAVAIIIILKLIGIPI